MKTASRYHPSRYHPVLVTLHWLLAVLILAALAVGFFALAAMENADPRKIAVRRGRRRPTASRRSCTTVSTSWSS
jgi:hypothetical protein